MVLGDAMVMVQKLCVVFENVLAPTELFIPSEGSQLIWLCFLPVSFARSFIRSFIHLHFLWELLCP